MGNDAPEKYVPGTVGDMARRIAERRHQQQQVRSIRRARIEPHAAPGLNRSYPGVLLRTFDPPDAYAGAFERVTVRAMGFQIHIEIRYEGEDVLEEPVNPALIRLQQAIRRGRQLLLEQFRSRDPSLRVRAPRAIENEENRSLEVQWRDTDNGPTRESDIERRSRQSVRATSRDHRAARRRSRSQWVSIGREESARSGMLRTVNPISNQVNRSRPYDVPAIPTMPATARHDQSNREICARCRHLHAGPLTRSMSRSNRPIGSHGRRVVQRPSANIAENDNPLNISPTQRQNGMHGPGSSQARRRSSTTESIRPRYQGASNRLSEPQASRTVGHPRRSRRLATRSLANDPLEESSDLQVERMPDDEESP